MCAYRAGQEGGKEGGRAVGIRSGKRLKLSKQKPAFEVLRYTKMHKRGFGEGHSLKSDVGGAGCVGSSPMQHVTSVDV